MTRYFHCSALLSAICVKKNTESFNLGYLRRFHVRKSILNHLFYTTDHDQSNTSKIKITLTLHLYALSK
jgi:hypothetical protein